MYMDDYRVDGTFVCESVRLRRPLVATRPSAEPTSRPATLHHSNPSISRPRSLSTSPLEPAVAEGLSARRCRRHHPRRRSESPPWTRPRPRPRHPHDAAARTNASAAPAPAPLLLALAFALLGLPVPQLQRRRLQAASTFASSAAALTVVLLATLLALVAGVCVAASSMLSTRLQALASAAYM